VSHVDELWEEAPGSSSTLQVRQAAAAAAAPLVGLSTSCLFLVAASLHQYNNSAPMAAASQFCQLLLRLHCFKPLLPVLCVPPLPACCCVAPG
jgi:hypothetical protein